MRRAERVAVAFGDWLDAVNGHATAERTTVWAERLTERERRELRAAIRDAEWIRGWAALMVAAFGAEVRRDERVRARPMDEVR